jgi:hypothetical protein
MAAIQNFNSACRSMAITNKLLDHVKFGMEIDNKHIYTLSVKYSLQVNNNKHAKVKTLNLYQTNLI